MMGLRWCLLVVAVLLASCTEHRQLDEREREVEACSDSALLEAVEGRWWVGFAIYERGAKPPGPRRIGELVISGCEFRFVASDAAESGERRPELEAAAVDIPLTVRRAGRVEVLAESVDDRNERRSTLGYLRFATRTWYGAVEAWDVEVRRVGAEYFYLWPHPDQPFHGTIDRGTPQRFLDEIQPSSDPDSPAPRELQERMRRFEQESNRAEALGSEPR